MDREPSSIAQKFWKTIIALLVVVLVGYLGVWVSVLAAREPLNHPLAHLRLWPVACSTRGCITTAEWINQHGLALTFARAANQGLPTSSDSLTTAVRRHMVEHAFLRSPVTIADAERYREEVLNTTDAAQLQEILEIDQDSYDSNILLPFLQQEALREQLKVESTQELYGALSADRAVFVLPFYFSWNKEKGEIKVR